MHRSNTWRAATIIVLGAVVAALASHTAAAQTRADTASPTWDTPLARSLTMEISPKLLVFTPTADAATITFGNPGDSLLEATVRVVFYTPQKDAAGHVNTTAVLVPDSGAPSAADWIVGVPTHVVLRPRQRVDVPVRLTAPRGIPNGDYRALIWLTSTRALTLPAPGDHSANPALVAMSATLNDQSVVVYRQGTPLTAAAAKVAYPYANGNPVFAHASGRPHLEDTTVVHSDASIYDVLTRAGHFRTFLELAEMSGLDAPLRDVMRGVHASTGLEVRESVQLRIARSTKPGEGVSTLQRELGTNIFAEGQGITVFAPTDSAFAALPPDTLAAIRRDTLRAVRIVRAHMTPTYYMHRGLTEYLSRVQGLDGSSLSVDVIGAKTVVTSVPVVEHQFGSPRGVATMIGRPIATRNGLVYEVDGLLARP